MLTSILLLTIVNTLTIAYLAYATQRAGARVDLADVAKRIAEDLLRDYSPGTLDRQGAEQFVRTRYMQLVTRYGLPDGQGQRVAGMVWALIQQVDHEPDPIGRGFSFYS